jgi:glycine cleavage system H protein
MQWEIRAGYKYTRKHEWVKQDGNIVTSGITDYAQDMLKDIVYVELPAVGREVKAGESYAVIESVKAVSDCYAPVDGVVIQVNEALLDRPELLNSDPYGAGWIARFEAVAGYEYPALMTDGEYETFVRQEEAG